MVQTESQYLERASVSDFKDTATPQLGHSDVVFFLLLVTNIKRYCLSIMLNKRKLLYFDIKSDYFDPVKKKLKKF